jgi:arylformamidase
LFRTANSARCWQAPGFVEDFVFISEDAAVHIAAAGIQTVGVDYLSVGGYHADGAKIHRTLLDAGIWIIERPQLVSRSARPL